MMFKFVAIFAIGLLIVLHINSPKINSTVHVILSNEQSVIQDTRQQIGILKLENPSPHTFSFNISYTCSMGYTFANLTSSSSDETVTINNSSIFTIIETTSSTTTTERPFIPLFRCDFNTSCFGNNQLIPTNGSEFNPAPSPNGLEPPRAPTSDVTSITTPTDNNEKCKLPYPLLLGDNINNTYSNMRFCYNNTCETSNVQEMTSTIIITERAFGPLFRCDFDSACFADDQIRRTNGSEFDPLPPPSGLEPPRAPTSDVTSITALTSNNETCRLPYQLSLDNNMNPTYPYMRFCYNNTCETDNGDIATCASGLYGLVSLNLSDSPTIISHSFNYNSTPGDSVGEQCLRFYYYFTIYNGQDWKQQIDVLIRPDNDAGRGFLIGNLTILDMEENGWQLQYITFNSTFSNYTLAFSFIVGIENRTVNSTLNRTIHFALDNIELYDFNCAYVNDQLNPTTPPTVVTSPSGK
ncbi:unnamed protein product [Rotaria sordida]|uniref:MAM domain-containing protein n=1 Tax=Rotaria sordida TaxID=392033 RepID=A0A815T5H9_9BILA|nr:unnamed protein product [Rotaria sordida]